MRDKTFQLSDHRKLAYVEYGDPKGKPLFYFHGWPGSRLSGVETDEAGRKLGVRIISIDRPGFGLSDYQEKRTLLDWPNDVAELADHLKIKKFSIMGVSGGGPYAAAVAYKIPNRIKKVGIVVGLAPVNIKGNLDGISLAAKISWANFYRFASLRSLSSLSALIGYRYFSKFSLLYGFQSGSDKKIIRKWLVANKRDNITSEAFRNGIKGPSLDLKLYTDDWGFNLKDIKTKVYLWYGAKDKNVSLNMGKYYKSQILDSELFIDPDGGHLFRNNIEEEILRTLV